MPRKLTNQEFLEKLKNLNSNVIPLEEYKGSTIKIKYKCFKCGHEWLGIPGNLLQGQGCPECAKIARNLSKIKHKAEVFVEKANKVHNNKYDYSKTVYKGTSKKIIITCPIHGDFEQLPGNHLSGQGCPKCANNQPISSEEWIEKAQKIHGNTYDYSKSIYVNANTEICIICSIHGEFWQLPNNHLKGCGCPKCGKLAITSNTNEFIQKATLVHGDRYNYSKVKYVKNSEPVIIICPIHGEYPQTPNCHLAGCGCPKCNKSHGEQIIEKYLIDNKINYISEYEIDIDININKSGKARIDFYLPDLNVAIEYNGEQHYRPIKYFEINKSFEIQQKRDQFIRDYCYNNNLKLIEIPYNEDILTYLKEINDEKVH